MNKVSKNYYKITVSDMAPHVHKFLPGENKTEKIFNWLVLWIKNSLECRKIQPYYLLPSKADLAYHIGVSQGTIQNAIRLLENNGYVESKQRIGTYVKDPQKESNIEKLTSKRELATEIIKKFILENNYKKGEKLISIRKLAQLTGIPNTTLRFAITTLVQDEILNKKNNTFVINNTNYNIENVDLQTLVEKTEKNLKDYIQKNLKLGDKLPSNLELSKLFGVSVKTVHDAIKHLSKEGLLYIRRGQYGTVVTNDTGQYNDTYLYLKYEQKIRQYIVENCSIEDKLPSIKEFAQMFNISEKTIKKALDNLAEDGYITYVRGRYGGTFVVDMPQTGETYKWLAISTDYINN